MSSPLKGLSRELQESLLEALEANKVHRQRNLILSYNNPEVVGEEMVHKIQTKFHQDPSKVRVFLGGNRCLAGDTLILQPNNRTIKIQDLKAGDVVLAVDPDTRDTLPVPVAEVFNQGEQLCHQYGLKYPATEKNKTINCTTNHHLLTFGGLQEAGYIRGRSELPQIESVFFSGSQPVNPGMAFVLGLILPGIAFENYRPIGRFSSSIAFFARSSMSRHDIEGHIQKDGTGRWVVFGRLGKYLVENCVHIEKFYNKVLFEWGSECIKQFLAGLLRTKLRKIGSEWVICCRTVVEARFVCTALTSIGVFLKPGMYDDRQASYLLGIKTFHDLERIGSKLLIPEISKKIRAEVSARKDRILRNPKWTQQENYFAEYTSADQMLPFKLPTYDIKLSGGHNLFVANGFIVSNSGKTEAGAVEAYWYASGTHPHKQVTVPNMGRVICESLEHFEQVIIPKFKRWVPDFQNWKEIKGHQGKIAGYKLPNGSRIDVFTFNQESAKLEGHSLRWAWVDEPPPREHIVATRRGLVDLDGDIWFTLTPLSEPWMYQEYVTPAEIKGPASGIGLYYASIWDNPWLKRESIQTYLNSLAPEERHAREHGKFLHLTGRVFNGFDVKTHVIPKTRWPKSLPVTIGIDPHLRKNHVAVFLGLNRKGWYVAIDEVSCAGDLEEFGHRIAEKVIELDVEVQRICADSFLEQPDSNRQEPRKILDAVLRSYGLPAIKIADKKNTKQGFISEMRRLLKVREFPQLGKGISGPEFYAMDCCEGVINDFCNYVYKAAHRAEITGPSEDPIKRFDDYLDALKYAFLADPQFESRVKFNHTPVIETYGASLAKRQQFAK